MKSMLVCLLLLVCLLEAGIVPAQQAAPVQQAPPHYMTVPCPPEIDNHPMPECGYLLVPENRANPESNTISMFVVRFLALRAAERQPDPIIVLQGGPGFDIAVVGAFYMHNAGLAALSTRRDVIFVDQRGTGLSLPSLDCLETEPMFVCRNRLLAAGIDFTGYTTREIAADINDLRLALGYEQVNLFGISFGTRLALFVLRDYPASVRSVILDSAYPPQINFLVEDPANLQRALDLLFATCAADETCNSRHPDLETRFYALVDRLNATPMLIQQRNLRTGETSEYLLSGDLLIADMSIYLQFSNNIPRLPLVIDQLEAGRTTLYNNLQWLPFNNAEGMYLSVQCADEFVYSSLPEIDAALEMVDPHVAAALRPDYERIDTVCAMWGAAEPDPRDREPVSSEVPALIVGGEFDPVTPPAWGRLAAETLPNSYFYEFPQVTHAVIVSSVIFMPYDCPMGMALAFLNDPTTTPDSTCIADEFTGIAFR